MHCYWATVRVRVAGISESTIADGQMVDHLTFSILTADSGARILTFIPNASAVRWAIAVQGAFWPTTFIWISGIFRQAFACADAILLAANGIRTAWRRMTGVVMLLLGWILFSERALREWIAGEPIPTDTNCRMAHDATLCVQTANARTRVFAVTIDTGEIASAFGICDTFWSAVRWVANEIGETVAQVRVSGRSTFSVRATR